MDRRRFVLGAGVVLSTGIAGCFGENSETLIDQSRRRVRPDEYLIWEFELFEEAEVRLQTTVRDGPRVDVHVADPQEFRAFERNERFRSYEISQLNTIGEETSGILPSGEYFLFIYNDDLRSEATVDIELTAIA